MRNNALLKLLMGTTGGLVLTVSGTQCRNIVGDNSPIDTEAPIAGTYQATDTEWEPELGWISDDYLYWQLMD